MTARARMSMRAVIQRNTESTTDGLGQPKAPSFSTLATVACWAWSAGKREVNDRDKIVLIEDIRCMVPKATDVTEADQIANITDRQGTVRMTGPFLIDIVQPRFAGVGRSHLELMLRQVD